MEKNEYLKAANALLTINNCFYIGKKFSPAEEPKSKS